MKETNITEADVVAVANRIENFSSHIPSTGVSADTRPPAIKVIDCVLSLRTSYDNFVVPRLETFKLAHPDIKQVAELAKFIASYPTPHEFIVNEFKYNSERKAKMLQEVVKFVCQIAQKTPDISEEMALKRWAIRSKPHECYVLNIKYFKLAGFQYLRMLFGADTAKPDVHIIRFLSDTLNRKVSSTESLLLLEAASPRVGFSVRAVDSFIWKRGARGRQDASGVEIVQLDPDVAAAFPTAEAVNEALRSVLKERGKKK